MDLQNEVYPWISGYGLSDEGRANLEAEGADFAALEAYCAPLKHSPFDEHEITRIRAYIESWRPHSEQMWSSWYMFRTVATIDALQAKLDDLRDELAKLEEGIGR